MKIRRITSYIRNGYNIDVKRSTLKKLFYIKK